MFWLGIIVGFVTAWCIHKLFNYGRYLNSEQYEHDKWKRS